MAAFSQEKTDPAGTLLESGFLTKPEIRAQKGLQTPPRTP
jgi:hypothetical protein